MLKKLLICTIATTVSLFSFAQKLKPPIKTIIIDPGHGGVDQGATGDHSTEAHNALAISFKVRDLLNKDFPEIKTLMTRQKDELPGGGSNVNAALRYRANFANQNKGDLFLCIHLNSTSTKYLTRQDGTRTETYYSYSGRGKHKKKVAHTKEVPNYVRYKAPDQVHGTQTYIWAAGKSGPKEQAIEASGMMNEDEGMTDTSMSEEMNPNSMEFKLKAQQYLKYFFHNSLSLANNVEDEFKKAGRYSFGTMQRNEKGIWVLQATNMPSILVETGFISDPKEEDYLSSEDGQQEVAQCIVNAVKRYKENLELKQKNKQGANQQTGEPAMVTDPGATKH
jgi:N-acetylmuramoyl-L-alanine amidase